MPMHLLRQFISSEVATKLFCKSNCSRMAVSAMSDEENWFYDEALELFDEEFTDFMYVKEETIHQWQYCAIGVLGSLHGTILKLLLFSTLKRFLVFLYAKGKHSLPV